MTLPKPHVLTARYTVLLMLSQFKSAAHIAKEVGVNESNVKRRIYVLEKQGYLVKGPRSSYRIWYLTDKGKGFVEGLRMVIGTARSKEGFSQKLRRHQLIFRFRAKRDFLNREKNLLPIGFLPKNRGLKTMQGFEIQRRGVKLFWNGRSLLLFPEPIYGVTVSEILLKGLSIAEEARIWFESQTRIELDNVCQTLRQQIALEGGVSRLVPDKFYEDDRLIVDASTGTIELEVKDKRLAPDDMFKLMAHFNRIIRGDEELPE